MTEPTPTSLRRANGLTEEQEKILTFLKAFPHSDLREIAWHSSPDEGSCQSALDFLRSRGYVNRSPYREDGWEAILYKFDTDGGSNYEWPHERGWLRSMEGRR